MKKRNEEIILFILLERVSFFLFTKGFWFVDNLSTIGNMPEYRLTFFFWAFLYTLCFFIPLIKIIHSSFLYQTLTKTSLLTFWLSIFIPFDVNSTDFPSVLHVPFASISLICIFLSLLYIINYLKENYPQYYFHLIKQIQILIIIIALPILIFSQINSIVELLFITLIIPLINNIVSIIKS